MNPNDLPPSPSVNVRRAVPEDLHGMANVHVETWKTTYRGIVADELLDHLTVERDISRGFGRWLTEPPEGEAHFVAVTERGEIVGYAICGPTRGEDPDFTGELGAIYVLKNHQGHGIGTSLVREGAGHLLKTGRKSMIAWVLAQNPYCRFYEHLGGVVMRRRTEPHLGTHLPELGYGWKDVRTLAVL
jgi:ribosomal protein S18 acetylase RimI-like enzyme